MSREERKAERPAGRSTYRMIWRLTEGQRLRYGAAIAALVVASCFLYLVPLVPQIVLDGVLAAEPERASALVRRAMDLAGGREFLRAHLWLAAAAMLVLSAASGGLTYVRGRWSALASEEIARRLRNRLYDHLQRLTCSWHDRSETGDTVQRCTSDVETFRQFLSGQVVEIGRGVCMMLVPIPLMLAIDARMTLVSILIVPPVVVFAFFFMRRVRQTFQRVDEAEGRMTSCLQENLTGIRVVRAFARQEFEEERFDGANASHRRLDYRLYVVMAWFWSCSDLLCIIQLASVLGAGGYWLAAGRLQVGAFFFFLSAVNLFIWPVRMMGRILTELGKALVAMGRIADVLERERETMPEHPLPLLARRFAGSGVDGDVRAVREDRQGPIAGGRAAGSEIAFEGVGFGHHGGVRAVDAIDLAIASGETVAFLGPSGSGKSTLIHLLLRFYEVESGRILVDGVDISRVDRRELRSRISVVMQEPFLYSKTVEENIRLGSAGAREEEIISAATAARVHDSILGFESGYRTLVGERGVTLSGGQRQRVALARALLRSTPILVLDDALSAVDTDTETEILDALRRLKGSRTTIVIAHRLTTLMHADRIVVFERGRIAQIGSHAELLRQEGLYRRLWQHQSALESDFDEERRRFDTAEETRTSRGAEEMMEARERHGVKAPGEQSIRQGAEVAEES